MFIYRYNNIIYFVYFYICNNKYIIKYYILHIKSLLYNQNKKKMKRKKLKKENQLPIFYYIYI